MTEVANGELSAKLLTGPAKQLLGTSQSVQWPLLRFLHFPPTLLKFFHGESLASAKPAAYLRGPAQPAQPDPARSKTHPEPQRSNWTHTINSGCQVAAHQPKLSCFHSVQFLPSIPAFHPPVQIKRAKKRGWTVGLCYRWRTEGN